jgi:hypothetical protein
MLSALVGLLILLLFLVIVFWIAKIAVAQFGVTNPVVLQIVGLILLLLFLIGAVRILDVPLPVWLR